MKIKTTADKIDYGIMLIRSEDGTVKFDGTRGRVSIKGVVASFTWDSESETLHINILDKPWLATQSMIETEINKFFK